MPPRSADSAQENADQIENFISCKGTVTLGGQPPQATVLGELSGGAGNMTAGFELAGILLPNNIYVL